MIEQWQETVAKAARDGQPIALRGGGSKRWLGQVEQGEVLELGAWSGIVDYEPSELVVTVRAGTPLTELEAALDARGQLLAFEPPRFDAASTIGGVVAAGLSGPRRVGYGAINGALRESVLGVRLLDGQGRHLRFGGTVMKNVAGYDVSRLIAGSMGVLGILTEVSLKVLPKPPVEATLTFDCGEAEALARVNGWGGQPLPLSGSAWHASPGGSRRGRDGSRGGTLSVRLSGAEPAVSAAVTRLGGERLPDDLADRHWRGLRDQTDAFFDSDRPIWRLGVPPTTPPLDIEADTLIEWHGAQRFVAGEFAADELRARVRAVGGHATAWRSRSARREASAFTPPSPGLMTIHRRLKAEFDPSNVFNRGRLFPDL